MKKIIFVVSALVLMYSCKKEHEIRPRNSLQQENPQQNNELTKEEKKSLVLLSKDQSVTEAEARKSAEEAMNELIAGQAGSNLRFDGSLRFVSGVTKVGFSGNTDPGSRASGSTSTMAYIVNFSDGSGKKSGFAVIGGDKRLPSVLGISYEGSLEKNVDNPGAYMVLSNLEAFARNEIETYESRYAGYLESAKRKLGIRDTISKGQRSAGLFPAFYTTYGSWKNSARRGPFVPVTWNQGSPYNDDVPKYCDSRKDEAPAGCVAIAIGQICSANEFPAKINSNSLSWTAINAQNNAANLSKTNRNDVADLISYIGEKVGMDYGCSESGAGRDDAKNGLRALGFKTSGVEGFNTDKVISNLNLSKPVYTAGNAKKETSGMWFWETTSYKEGHAWVIDGYLVRKRTVKIYLTGNEEPLSTGTDEQTLLHCNFGWGGGSNGYYFAGAFDTNAGPEVRVTSGQSGNFQYNIQMIKDITPD
jgi:hypothetical protein